MFNIKHWWSIGVVFSFTLILSGTALAGNKVFYRYVNDEGVKVLNHTIPPEYAQKGYEILSATGHVIKVVEPAISKEEGEKLAAERRARKELALWDASLRRRYSSVADIEAAKKRKLLELEANMSVLNTNIEGLKEQIETMQSKAAQIERSGREVSESLLANLKGLHVEMENTKAQVVQRKEEYRRLLEKYDRDIERFKVIEKQ
ncbi:MAG: hypothetical protein P8Y45_06890 [Exilibacterium sp.]